MITREQVPAVLDHTVYDSEGKKIGQAKHVFLDDRTGEPEWATVRTGMFGTHESFVPIHDARLTEDHVEVSCPKSKVNDAPHVDVESGGHLSEREERELYRHYGVDWAGGDAARGSDQGRAGTRGSPGATTGAAGAGAAGAASAGGAAAATGAGRESGAGMTRGGPERESRTDRGTEDDAMTRSEEQMRVRTEEHESGRARLRKYVVTEDVEQTVPVRHEGVRVEREPITDANRDEAMRGPDIGKAEHEVTLHEERPVVETEAVPVERVRMVPEEHTEQETVRGKVRKEQIEEEMSGKDDPDNPDQRGRRT